MVYITFLMNALNFGKPRAGFGMKVEKRIQAT